MTESAALATRGYNAIGMHRYSSAGLLGPNIQAKVVDWVTGAHLPPGSVGELWLRTPGNMKGIRRFLFGIYVFNSKKFCKCCCYDLFRDRVLE